MTSVTLEESREYALWLSFKVLWQLLSGLLAIVIGAGILFSTLQGGDMPWYLIVIGIFALLSGILGIYATFIGVFFKMIADAVEAGVVSSNGEEVEIGLSWSDYNPLERFRSSE